MKQPLENIAQLKKYVSASSNVQFADIEQDLQNSFEDFVLPLLGLPTYAQIQSSENAIHKELIEKIKLVVANHAFYNNSARNLVNRTQAGSTASEKIKLWQYKSDQSSYKLAAYNGIDRILKYLEAYPDIFRTWHSSDICTEYKSCFVANTDTFQRFQDINNSRILFLKCKANLNFVQSYIIKPILGEPLYEVLLSEYIHQALVPKHAQLLTWIQPAMVHWAYQESMPLMLLDAESLGIALPKSEYEQNSFELSELLQSHSKNKASFFLSALQGHLNENVRNYPQYEFSKYYIKNSHLPPSGSSKIHIF